MSQSDQEIIKLSIETVDNIKNKQGSLILESSGSIERDTHPEESKRTLYPKIEENLKNTKNIKELTLRQIEPEMLDAIMRGLRDDTTRGDAEAEASVKTLVLDGLEAKALERVCLSNTGICKLQIKNIDNKPGAAQALAHALSRERTIVEELSLVGTNNASMSELTKAFPMMHIITLTLHYLNLSSIKKLDLKNTNIKELNFYDVHADGIEELMDRLEQDLPNEVNKITIQSFEKSAFKRLSERLPRSRITHLHIENFPQESILIELYEFYQKNHDKITITCGKGISELWQKKLAESTVIPENKKRKSVFPSHNEEKKSPEKKPRQAYSVSKISDLWQVSKISNSPPRVTLRKKIKITLKKKKLDESTLDLLSKDDKKSENKKSRGDHNILITQNYSTPSSSSSSSSSLIGSSIAHEERPSEQKLVSLSKVDDPMQVNLDIFTSGLIRENSPPKVKGHTESEKDDEKNNMQFSTLHTQFFKKPSDLTSPVPEDKKALALKKTLNFITELRKLFLDHDGAQTLDIMAEQARNAQSEEELENIYEALEIQSLQKIGLSS